MGSPGFSGGSGVLCGVPVGLGVLVGSLGGLDSLCGVLGPCVMPPGVPRVSGVPVGSGSHVQGPCVGPLGGLGSLCGTIGVSMGSGLPVWDHWGLVALPVPPLVLVLLPLPGALPGAGGSPNARALKTPVQAPPCPVSVGLLLFSTPGVVRGGRGLPEPAPLGRSPVLLRSSGVRGEV